MSSPPLREAPRSDPTALLPGGVLPPSRLRQFLAYCHKVFSLKRLLSGIRDRRQKPEIPTSLVSRIVFLTGLLRIRSFNALEPRLSEPSLVRALNASLRRCGKICSVDTLGYSLSRMEIESARSSLEQMVKKAERNKAFREGWLRSLRYVAIDGWEAFRSRKRHCPHCLTRECKVKGETVTEYFHRYVVALLIDERTEVVLGIEEVRSADIRAEAGEEQVEGHEGELTAAKRLVRHLKATYGRWIEVLLLDSLYSNGPFLTVAKECGYGVLAVLKKKHNEPYKEALSLWEETAPEQVYEDKKKKERLELWDVSGLETLESYEGPIRVVRGVVKKEGSNKPTVWSVAVTGVATRLSTRQVLEAIRGRWHEENTAFHQWTSYWNLTHVFSHQGFFALLLIFALAFNLLQMFLYRQLKSYGRDKGKDVTQTISRLIDEMQIDLILLDEVLLWDSS